MSMPDVAGPERGAAVAADLVTLASWAVELRTLAGLVASATASSSDAGRPDAFRGAGTSGAWLLRHANATGLAALHGAAAELDRLVAQLRDAAQTVTRVYPDSDGSAAMAFATVADIRHGLRVEHGTGGGG
jgi:hypothetical protein